MHMVVIFFTWLGIECALLWLLGIPKCYSQKGMMTKNNHSFSKEQLLIYLTGQDAAAALASSIG